MQSKGKERVICLTAERRTKRRGFKGSLHVCKVSSGAMQVCAQIALVCQMHTSISAILVCYSSCSCMQQILMAADNNSAAGSDPEVLLAEIHHPFGGLSIICGCSIPCIH